MFQCRVVDHNMLAWIIKKTGAETHSEFVRFENAIVSAALAALPEFRVICQK